jgi:hypothetical protein
MADVLPNFDELPEDSNQAPKGAPSQSQGQSFDALVPDEDKYGGAGEQVLAAGEGLANTLTGGLYSVAAAKADEALGLDPSYHEHVREENPVSYGAGQVGGILTGAGAIKGAAALGETAAAELGGGLATKFGVENALFTLGDQISKSVSQNPDSIQTAALHVGLSGILGAGAGKILGKASELWMSKFGEEAEGFAKGFTDNLKSKSSIQEGPIPGFPPAPGTPLFKEAVEEAAAPMAPKGSKLGQKVSDFLSKKAVNAVSEGVADAAGAFLGHGLGIPGGSFVGGMLGHQFLKPILTQSLPALLKPLIQGEASGTGLRAAFQAVNSIVKGDALLSKAAKAVFETSSADMQGLSLEPDDKTISQLREHLNDLEGHPEALMNVGGDIGHYMPGHQTALAATTQNAVDYLNSQKPRDIQPGLLNKPMQPSKSQESAYNRTLAIAEQPLSVLQRLHDGTLSGKDVADLHALYPAIAPQIIQRVQTHMIEHMSKEKVVPFKLRRGLSLLTGQPIDSTFTQPSMAAAQAVHMPAQPPQQAQGKASAKKSTAKVGKSAELAQEPSQARQTALSKA